MRQVFSGGVPVDSDVWDRVVRGPHQVDIVADILLDNEVVVAGANVVGGSVTYNRRAATLARADITLIEPTRLPVTGGPLSPLGFEIRLQRVVRADVDLSVFLGVFPIQRSNLDGDTLLTDLHVEDRSRRVRDARFEDDVSIAADVNYADAIRDLIDAGVPGLEFLFPSTSETTPILTFEAAGDRWGAAQGMARSLGNELIFDGLGRQVMRPEPTFDTSAPDVEFTDGDDGVLIRPDVVLDRGPAFNGIHAVSSNPSLDDVFRAFEFDNDPSSPTYYFGSFGKKVRERPYASPFIASQSQASSAARSILRSNLGVARSVSMSVVPNARFEAGDSALIRSERIGMDEVQVADEVTIPLSAEGEMVVQSRAKQLETS